MPSIVDMGIAPYMQPAKSVWSDPQAVVGMMSLRERQRSRRSDEQHRDRLFEQGQQEFERSAAQRDRSLDMTQGGLDLRQQAFQRDVSQEDAAADVWTKLGDELGLFEHEDPTTGARMGVPEFRQKFAQMSPDAQRQALSMHMEQLAQESEQEEQRQEMLAAQTLMNGFQSQVSGWVEGRILSEQDEAVLVQRMTDALSGASGEKPYQVREDAVALMEHGVEMTRRKDFAANILNSTLPMLNATPGLRSRLLHAITSYTSGGDASMTDSDLLRLQADLLDQLRQPTTEQLAGDLTTAMPNASPEAAGAVVRLREAGIPIGVGDANLSGQNRKQATEGQKAKLRILEDRVKALQNKEFPDETELARAKNMLEREWEKVYGEEFPGEPSSESSARGESGGGGNPDDIRRAAFSQALSEAKESGTVDRKAVEKRARELIAQMTKDTEGGR